jgi:hypothetical protein
MSEATLRMRGGTCTVAVPMRDGLVLAADRLVTADDHSPIGDETKLHAVGNRVLFVVTGKTAFGTNAQGNNLFDAVSLSEQYLAAREIDGVDWADFRRVVGGALKNALESIPFEVWPQTAVAPRSLLQILTYWIDAKGEIRLSVVSVSYERKQPVGLVLNWQAASASNFAVARPMIGASVEVWNEVKTGHDPRFDDLRADPLFARLIPGTAPATSLSEDDAVRFVQRIIEETSKRKAWLGGAPDVGATSDVLVLDRARGIRPPHPGVPPLGGSP